MGLDMYLEKRTYVKNWEHNGPEGRHEISVKKGGKKHPHIKTHRISNIIEEVGYWRKFNALHNWFVNNVQEGEDNCEPHYVSLEKMEQLIKVLEKVVKNKAKASEELPTTSGFFFGGTEYDEYYFEDCKRTLKLMKQLVKEKGGDFYYQSSW